MVWTAPRTWTTGELVTAAIMNLHVRDQLSYLKGLFHVTTGHPHDGATTDAGPQLATAAIAAGAVTPAKVSGGLKPMRGDMMIRNVALGGSDSHRPVDPVTGIADEAWHLDNGETVNGVLCRAMAGLVPVGAGTDGLGETFTMGTPGGAKTFDNRTRHWFSHAHSHLMIGDMYLVTQGGPGYFLAEATQEATVQAYTDYQGSATQSIMQQYRGVRWFYFVG